MSGAFQNLIDAAFIQTAAAFGIPHTIYRPTSAASPLAPANAIAVINIYRADKSGKNKSPPPDKLIEWQGECDQTNLRSGDYVVGQDGYTHLIGHSAPFAAAQLIQCFDVVTVYDPQPQPGSGVALDTNGKPIYGGNDAANQVAVITGFPAAIVMGGRGDKGSGADLPGDVYLTGWTMFLSAGAGVAINSNMIVEDARNRTWIVSAAEQTDFWRVTMMQQRV